MAKRFANGTAALAGLDLSVQPGEFLSLVGPSGCGKSTALRLIAGLTPPSEGRVRWGGRDQPPPPGDIGFVFQEATLMPWARVLANVTLPLKLAHLPGRQAEDRAREALALVGLAGFEHSFPRELSGGMRMRVSIARALAPRPRLLLMDEPFAALDEFTRHLLQEDLRALAKESGCTTVFVTHSIYEAAFLATRVAVMSPRPGRIAATHGFTEPVGERLDATFAARVAILTQSLAAQRAG